MNVDELNVTKLYRLRVELANPISDALLQTLQKYGEVTATVSRDVVVPSDITLHALHYALQRSFGWRNSHLHHFSIEPDGRYDKLDELTGGTLGEWSKLCGLYLRCPYDTSEETMSDIYWDDDYNGRENPRMWMKRKYTGPYTYGGRQENYLYAQSGIQKQMKDYPIIPEPVTFEEYMENKDREMPDVGKRMVKIESLNMKKAGMFFESGMGELLERLRLDEVLITDGERADIAELMDTAERLARDALTKTELYQAWKTAKNVYERYYELCMAVIRIGESDVIYENNLWPDFDEKDSIDNRLKELTGAANNPVKPLTDTLYYSYDYGDGWELKITCADIYSVSCDTTALEPESNTKRARETAAIAACQVVDRAGNPVSDRDRGIIATAAVRHTVQCLSLDGLCLLDDVGGIYGYADMLETIRGKDKQAAKEMREWAKEQGWTGKPIEPEKLL